MEKEKKPKSILIVGVGNILLGDEGIGIHVIKKLERLDLPANVEILDMGVAAFSLIPHIPGREKIIIVDAVKAGGKAGSIYRFSIDEIQKEKDKHLSLHEVSIGDIWSFVQPHTSTEVVVIGVEPGQIKWGMELSPSLKEKIPQVVNLILKEIYPEQNKC